MTLRLILGRKRVLVSQFEPIWSWNKFVEGPRPLPFLFQGGKGVNAARPNNADDNRLLEGNPCTSVTEDELITTLRSTSSLKGERVPSTPNSCSATNCGTRIVSANTVLEAETAPTPNFLQNHLSTTPMDSVCDSHFPETKSPLLISMLLPDLLKESIVPRSAKHGLQNINLANPPIFVRGLPGGSAKTRPAGQRRGRPPRTPCEHSWQKVLLSFNDGRRRGRPPRSAAETLLLSWSHRSKGHRRGRPPRWIIIQDRVPDPIYRSAFWVLGIIFV